MKPILQKLKTFIALILFAQIAYSQAIVANHEKTVLDQIPFEWINQAKNDFKIWYGHTSHGSQISSGLGTIQDHFGSPYTFNYSGSGGALSYQELTWADLGHNGDLYWEQLTRQQLNSPSNDRNVIIWSWCGGVSDNTVQGINIYLNAMNQLESDYPNVKFVYMTGHLDIWSDANLKARNQQIRDYCIAHNKILFDFADIESYNPDGAYFQYASDDCSYYQGPGWGYLGNWANEWCNDNPGSDLCLNCSCAHSQALNCNLKGRAFWWMLAQMAGWNGNPGGTTTYSASPTTIDFGSVLINSSVNSNFIISNTGTETVIIDSIVVNNQVFNLNQSKISGFELNVNESQTINVSFEPTSVLEYSGLVTIYSMQAGNKQILLNGTGYQLPPGGFHVTGNVSGTWDMIDTIFVDGDISIPIGNTLTINPAQNGTHVIFTGHYKLSVFGRIIAVGSEMDSIFFYSLNQEEGWSGIRFFDQNSTKSDSSFLEYCSIKYGHACGTDEYENLGGGIFIFNCSGLSISQCLVKDNYACEFGGGIYMEYSSPLIANTDIVSNQSLNEGGGIFVGYSSGPELLNLNITGNNSIEGSGGGAYLFDGSAPFFNYGNINLNSAPSGGGITCNTDSAIIAHLYITDNQSYYEYASGGGISCNADPLITYCTFKDNYAVGYGGGISCNYESNPRIEYSIIEHNQAGYGGGVSCLYSSNPKITHSIFRNNSGLSGSGGGLFIWDNSGPVLENVSFELNNTVEDGAAIAIENSNGKFTNLKIQNNEATFKGGGISIKYNSSPVFYNALISENTAEWGAGIIFYENSGEPVFNNVTISNNTAITGGGGIACDYGNPVFNSSIIWNNVAYEQGNNVYLHNPESDPYFNYCLVENGMAGFEGEGAGNEYDQTRYVNTIESNPLFANESEGNFHLLSGSPAIDGGIHDTTNYNLPAIDLDGNTRIDGIFIDIGCYEYQHPDPGIQQYTLKQGWNGISSYLQPVYPQLDSVFQSIYEKTILLQNFEGIYWPAENTNTLGNWNSQSGYMLKVSENTTFSISGLEVTGKIIQLQDGWNLIPVAAICGITMDELVLQLGDNLIIVMEATGINLFWPSMGIATLANLESGKSYFILVTSSSEFSFPDCE